MSMRGLVALLALAAGCSRGAERSASGPVAEPPTGAAASTGASKGTLALGERITLPLVPLTEIASSPARFENRTVTTSGTVTAVCQEMGCWMELRDQSGVAHIRMHGHSFFVPKTSAGHVARVQANVLPRDTEECAESPSPEHGVAKVELDATGVEID